MMLDLQSSGSHSVDGNWKALGKLLIYCSGCHKGGLFNSVQIPDPCEHLDQGEEGDIGFFRGVFKSFSVSRVRKMLIERKIDPHPTEVCPYCKIQKRHQSRSDEVMMLGKASGYLIIQL
ncbi:hypothetical protein H6P81_019495 [Aristolochia fimbriata]|uniref:Uncharacterized protein n=1 Tax=Aristolochia fimbriata TaxID=158543 RepID=A0AAV7DTF7_ARIFI|nr:hypothetical protein H6P81_019495 [Aristolochia fimbriata]